MILRVVLTVFNAKVNENYCSLGHLAKNFTLRRKAINLVACGGNRVFSRGVCGFYLFLNLSSQKIIICW